MRSTGEKRVQRCDQIKLEGWRKIFFRSAIISIVLVIFVIGTGGSLNPTAWPEQVERRANPSGLLVIDDNELRELENEFIFFNRNIADGLVGPCFNGDTTIFHEIYCFITYKIKYKNDFSVYFSLDHLSKPSEVISKGADDCDGKAVLISTMLLKRGYDAYVVMGTEHTWVEVVHEGKHIYISYIDCENPVLVLDEPLPPHGSTYVRFNTSENIWTPLPLITQGLVVFTYILLILSITQLIYVNGLHVRPAKYISEIFGYFRYILYMFVLIFCVWVVMLLLIRYLSTLQ